MLKESFSELVFTGIGTIGAVVDPGFVELVWVPGTQTIVEWGFLYIVQLCAKCAKLLKLRPL